VETTAFGSAVTQRQRRTIGCCRVHANETADHQFDMADVVTGAVQGVTGRNMAPAGRSVSRTTVAAGSARRCEAANAALSASSIGRPA
jgi:hypothetical protein